MLCPKAKDYNIYLTWQQSLVSSTNTEKPVIMK